MPQQIVAMAVHWLLLIVVVGGIGAAVLGGLIWGSKKLLTCSACQKSHCIVAFCIIISFLGFCNELLSSADNSQVKEGIKDTPFKVI